MYGKVILDLRCSFSVKIFDTNTITKISFCNFFQTRHIHCYFDEHLNRTTEKTQFVWASS